MQKKGGANFFQGVFFLCFSADSYGIRSICGAESYLSFECIPLRVSRAVFRIPLCALVFFCGGVRKYTPAEVVREITQTDATGIFHKNRTKTERGQDCEITILSHFLSSILAGKTIPVIRYKLGQSRAHLGHS